MPPRKRTRRSSTQTSTASSAGKGKGAKKVRGAYSDGFDSMLSSLMHSRPADIADRLWEAERILDGVLGRNEPVLESKRIADTTSVLDRDVLISMAQRISYNVRAPDGWTPADGLAGGLRAAAPPPELMQAGLVYKKLNEEREKEEERKRLQLQLKAVEEEKEKEKAKVMKAESKPKPTPSVGPRPNKPIQIDMSRLNLPKPPPGWKPGDAVPIANMKIGFGDVKREKGLKQTQSISASLGLDLNP